MLPPRKRTCSKLQNDLEMRKHDKSNNTGLVALCLPVPFQIQLGFQAGSKWATLTVPEENKLHTASCGYKMMQYEVPKKSCNVTSSWEWLQHVGLTGGLARAQLCWILAKYSPLHHTSSSQIVHVRKLRFRLGGVSCLWHQFICLLVHCEIWFPLFIDTCMNFSIIFLKIWTDFWTLTVDRRVFSSWISLLLSHSCLKCVVFFKSFPCVICLIRNTHA